MKQVVQDFKDGKIKVIEAPEPIAEPGYLIVKNHFSSISSGTERTTVSTGKKTLIGKARSRPDLVKKVVDSIKKEGLGSTLKKVKSKLEDYKLLGYSSAGEIIDVGEGVCNFSIGDRVACAGGGYALHSEIIRVPVNLCAKIPEGVELEEAAFVTLGAIALQGVRQANVRVGERVGVIGLGLIGILTVQILKASGCRVFGIDIDTEGVDRAMNFSMDRGTTIEEDVLIKIGEFTDGFGLDSIIITAGTKSNVPVNLSSEILRDRGRVIIVGDVGMNLERENFYLKELGLNLSRSYGPGRYDPLFEEKGVDYPIGYIRWTEQRNMEAILDLISQKKIRLKELITHKFSIDSAPDAYDLILKGKEKFLGLVFEYGKEREEEKKRIHIATKDYKQVENVRIGIIGAGNFGKTFILPPLVRNSYVIPIGIATLDGADAVNVAQKFGFTYATADYKEILNDLDVDTVFILTRHNLHAKLVVEALNNDKNVYVEKPLAMREQELEEIKDALNNTKGRLMVGFNRRFSPHSLKLKEFIGKSHGPIIIIYRINAGILPPNHWLKDPDFGGGRIIGEVCHFIDYIRFLIGSKIKNLTATSVIEKDNKVIQIQFTDGSIGTISYITIGDGTFPKERVEVFVDGKIGIIDDFRTSLMSVRGKKKRFKTKSQDKGYKREIELFIKSIIDGEEAPISLDELFEVSEWTIAADRF